MKVVIDVPNSLYANLKKIANGSNACKRLLECVKAGEPVGNIDNAPTVEEITNEDIKSAINEGFKNGYEMAKAKFERPTEVNCSHCDYFTFSKRFIENVVELMIKYKIETVDDLRTELNHINDYELIRVKSELNNELKELGGRG